MRNTAGTPISPEIYIVLIINKIRAYPRKSAAKCALWLWYRVVRKSDTGRQGWSGSIKRIIWPLIYADRRGLDEVAQASTLHIKKQQAGSLRYRVHT